MSNNDKQALRDIAAAAESAPLWHAVGVFGEIVEPAKPEWKPVHDFCKTFTAERVLALLDELEAAEKRIADYQARLDRIERRCDHHGSVYWDVSNVKRCAKCGMAIIESANGATS